MHKTGNIRLMARTSLPVKPFAPHMLLAVFLDIVDFLCAIYIPYFGALPISHTAVQAADLSVGMFFVIILMSALLRGILRYGEQACSHCIAFKLFAILRNGVFTVLCRLTPAWLEEQDRGNLIYLTTSGIEVLEVSYAHTIFPVLIVVVTFGILLIQFAKMHTLFSMVILLGYLPCDVLLPLIITKLETQEGCQSREEFRRLGSYVLESLCGMQDVLQYHIGSQCMEEMQRKNEELRDTAECLKLHEGTSSILGDAVVTLFTFLMLLGGRLLYLQGTASFTAVLMSTVLMVSSFGLALTLASLSNNLLTTMASTRHVLQLPNEKEEAERISGRKQAVSEDIRAENLNFSYEKKGILHNVQVTFKKGRIIGIHGKSGPGKSALLKLIM